MKPDYDAIAAILDESVPGDVMTDVNGVFTEMVATHAIRVGPCRHLHGKGLRSALLVEALSRCDQEPMPAYLESSNPANKALYRQFGFETLGVIRAGHSPPMVPMLRGRTLTLLNRAGLGWLHRLLR